MVVSKKPPLEDSSWWDEIEELEERIIPIDVLLRKLEEDSQEIEVLQEAGKRVVGAFLSQVQARINAFLVKTYGVNADISALEPENLETITLHEFSEARRSYEADLLSRGVSPRGDGEDSIEKRYQKLDELTSYWQQKAKDDTLPVLLYALHRQQQMLEKNPLLYQSLPKLARDDPKHYGHFQHSPVALLYHQLVKAEGRLLAISALDVKKRILRIALPHAELSFAVPSPNFDSRLALAVFYLEAAKVDQNKKADYLHRAAAAAEEAEKHLSDGEKAALLDRQRRHDLERLGKVYLHLGKAGVPTSGERAATCYRTLINGSPVDETNNGYYGYLAQSLLWEGKISRRPQPLREALGQLASLEKFIERVENGDFYGCLVEEDISPQSLARYNGIYVEPANLWSMMGEVYATLARFDLKKSLEHLVQSIQYYHKAQQRGKEQIHSYLSFAYLKLGEGLLRYEKEMQPESLLPPLLQENAAIDTEGKMQPQEVVLQAARACFEQAFSFASSAIDKDNDQSPEIRSKKGMAAFHLAKMAMASGIQTGAPTVQDYLQQAKGSLESIYTTSPGTTFAFPWFVLAEMAEWAQAQSISSGWEGPIHYIQQGLKRFQRKESASFEVIHDRFNWVGVPESDYGLLKSLMVVKFAKGSDGRERLEQELRLTQQAERIYQDEPFQIPSVWGIIDTDQGSALVLRRMQGRQLAEILKIEESVISKGYMAKVVEALAKIHQQTSRFGPQAYAEGTSSFPLRLRGKLNSFVSQGVLSKPTAEKLYQGISPIVSSVGEGHQVIKKDAHPENWLIDDQERVVALDWEVRGYATPEYDLANLLELSPFSPSEKKVFYDQYGAAFVQIDQTRYWNAAIVRRLVFLCTGIDSGQSSSSLESMLDGTLQAVAQVRGINPGFFEQHKPEYLLLEQGLQEAKTLFSLKSK